MEVPDVETATKPAEEGARNEEEAAVRRRGGGGGQKAAGEPTSVKHYRDQVSLPDRASR